MGQQIETVTRLISMDEAIQSHLEAIAKRDHERELIRLAKERRVLEEKEELARLLTQHIGKQYGVCVTTAWIYDNLKREDGYVDDVRFRLYVEFEPEIVEGKGAVGTLTMLPAVNVEELQRPPCYIEWKALRSYFRPGDERRYDDFDECRSENFVEALTFAKTGKQ